MNVTMDSNLKEKLEQVGKMEWWPIATLANLLGRPKTYIYRRIDLKNFSVLEDGTFKKILSKSVIDFYENRSKNIKNISIEQNAFKKGFYAGLKMYETAQEMDVSLDDLQEMIANYCEGDHDDGDNERSA